MPRFTRSLLAMVAVAAPVALGAQRAPSRASSPLPAAHGQVLSIQPLWSTVGAFAGELERRVSSKWTLGVGGMYFGKELALHGGSADAKYASGDVKLRYYPGARALRGFSLGAQAGYSRVRGQATDSVTSRSAQGSAGGASMGAALDYSWLLGASDAFYVGVGAGVKALFIDKESVKGVTLAYPTARLSIGYAF